MRQCWLMASCLGGMICILLGIAQPAAAKETLALQAAVELALKASPEIKQAEAELASARAAVDRTKATLYPDVLLESTVGTYRDRRALPGTEQVPSTPEDRNQYQAAFVVKQNLFNGLVDKHTNSVARQTALAQEAGLNDQRARVVRDVIELYFTIQLELRKLAAEKEVQVLRQRQFDEVKNRLRFGRATELEKLQAEYSLKAQTPAIRELESTIEQTTLQLVRKLGLAVDQELALKDDLPAAVAVLGPDALPTLAQSYERAVNNNPDLMRARLEFEAERSRQQVDLGKHLPKADLVLRAGTDANLREEIGDSSSQVISGELQLSIPLFSGLDSFAERREKEAKLQGLQWAERQQRELVLENLADAYRRVQLAQDRTAAEEVNQKLAAAAIKQAETLYAAGRATLSDVLDSYSSKLNAIKSLAQARYDRLQATVEIKYLIGAPFVSANPGPASPPAAASPKEDS